MIATLLLGLSVISSTHPGDGFMVKGHRPSLVYRGPKNELIPEMIRIRTTQSQAALLQAGVTPNGVLVPGGQFVSRIGTTGWTIWRVAKGTDTRMLAAKISGRQGISFAE